MAYFKYLLISVLILFAGSVFAKDGKIKFGKYIRYEGSIVDKQANGPGVLKIHDAEEKGYIALTFNGEFTTINNIKKIHKTNKEKYDLTTLKISNGTVHVKSGWKYVGDIDITIDDYNKNNKFILNAVLEKGCFINDDETTIVTTPKIKCEITTFKDEQNIEYSPNINDVLSIKVVKSDQKIDVTSLLNQMFFQKQFGINNLEGKAFLDNNGSLLITEGYANFTSDNYFCSYNVILLDNKLSLTNYTYKGVCYEPYLNGLYLKTIKIADANYSFNGELTDIHQSLYHGTIAGKDLGFIGDYTINFAIADPDVYANASKVITLVKYKSGELAINGNKYTGSWDDAQNFHGTLIAKEGTYEGDWDGIKFSGTFTKGSEIFEGTWEDEHNFKGSYSNKDLLISLKECVIQDDTLLNGLGEKTILPDSVIYSGSFIGIQCNGEGTLNYKSFAPIFSEWENDIFIKGHTTINLAGKVLSYEIAPTDEGYDFFFNGKKAGKSDNLTSLFYDLKNNAREYCRKEILKSSDISMANRLFSGKEFFGTLDPSILFDNSLDAQLGSDIFDKIGTFCLDVKFSSQDECVYQVYLDTDLRSDGYNSMDLLLGNPLGAELLFGIFRAAMSDFEEKTNCIYTVRNDSVIFYKANSLELCDRMKIINKGQKLQAKEVRGYRTISKVR